MFRCNIKFYTMYDIHITHGCILGKSIDYFKMNFSGCLTHYAQ